MNQHILCINSGSPFMKHALHLLDPTKELISGGAVERIGLSEGWLWLKDGQGERLVDSHSDFTDHKTAVKSMFTAAIEEQHLPASEAVGHRLEHGGAKVR